MRTWRWVLGGAVGGLLLVGLSGTAGAEAQTIVKPGALTVLSDVFSTLPTLPAPTDGRIRGYGFSARVTGEQCAARIGDPGDELGTISGYEVCAFRLAVSYEDAITVTDTGQLVPGLSVKVEAGTTAIPLTPDEVYAAADDEYAVAVRKGEPAVVTMSAAGFAQSFSLTTGQRIGTAPEVLYRAPSSYEVAMSPAGSTTIPETSGTDHATASVRIGYSSVDLTYFMPGDPLVRAQNPDDGFLDIVFTETDLTGPSGVHFDNILAMPGSDLHLVTTAGTKSTGASVGGAALGFAHEYEVPVPASVTTGTLTIVPGTLWGYEVSGSSSPRAARTASSKLVPIYFGTGTLATSIPDPLPVAPGGSTSTTTTTGPASTTTVPVSGTTGNGGTAGGTGSGGNGVTSTVGGTKTEHHHDSQRNGHKGQQQHSSGSGTGSGGTGGSGSQRTATLAIRPTGATATNDTTPVVAAAAAAGTSVIVIPLVIIWRRRREGKRLTVRFPPPVAEPPDPRHEGAEVAEGAGLEERAEVPDAAVVAVEPPSGPALSSPVLAVRVLGPVEVDGVGQVRRRTSVEELVCYMAIHAGREVSADELRNRLGTVESDLAPQSLRNIVSELRKALGKDVLVCSTKARYRLNAEVSCDWVHFKDLVRARTVDMDLRIEQLTEALGLVRGVPFSGVPFGQYHWALDGGVANEAAVLIDSAAVELAVVLTKKGRGREAIAAVRVGLMVSPVSLGLLAAMITAGALEGRIGLESAWREVVSVVGEEEELRALKERLELEIVGA